ncbi:MAG: hypothetical protein EOP07_18060 [Proteobacteria bacterium]|nr:MAG: hypothetical protein EOP07_18060 [Pseudomonadota bacterium]
MIGFSTKVLDTTSGSGRLGSTTGSVESVGSAGSFGSDGSLGSVGSSGLPSLVPGVLPKFIFVAL